MRSELLIDALDFLDEDMLEAAAAIRMQPVKKRGLRRLCLICAPLAACLFLMLAASIMPEHFFRPGSDNASSNTAGTLSGSGGTQSGDGSTAPSPDAFFDAVILEVCKGSVLVEPVEGSAELCSSDKIMVSTNTINDDELPELTVGKTIRIVYNGMIQETYPAQLGTVYAIYDTETVDGSDNP